MSAIQSSFQRVEKKYILSYEQYEAMRRGMCGHVKPDEYSHYSIGNMWLILSATSSRLRLDFRSS